MEVNLQQAGLPVKEWGMAMQLAASNICKLGSQLITTHRTVSERANEVCQNWKLAERQADERQALNDLIQAAKHILIDLDDALYDMSPESMQMTAFSRLSS